MQQYFANNSDLTGESTVVKLKDVAEYPTRGNAINAKKRIDRENKLYGALPGSAQKVKYSRCLHPGPKFQPNDDAQRLVKQFMDGKIKLHDHMGNEITPNGTKMDRVAKMAIPEDKARR